MNRQTKTHRRFLGWMRRSLDLEKYVDEILWFTLRLRQRFTSFHKKVFTPCWLLRHYKYFPRHIRTIFSVKIDWFVLETFEKVLLRRKLRFAMQGMSLQSKIVAVDKRGRQAEGERSDEVIKIVLRHQLRHEIKGWHSNVECKIFSDEKTFVAHQKLHGDRENDKFLKKWRSSPFPLLNC